MRRLNQNIGIHARRNLSMLVNVDLASISRRCLKRLPTPGFFWELGQSELLCNQDVDSAQALISPNG